MGRRFERRRQQGGLAEESAHGSTKVVEGEHVPALRLIAPGRSGARQDLTSSLARVHRILLRTQVRTLSVISRQVPDVEMGEGRRDECVEAVVEKRGLGNLRSATRRNGGQLQASLRQTRGRLGDSGARVWKQNVTPRVKSASRGRERRRRSRSLPRSVVA